MSPTMLDAWIHLPLPPHGSVLEAVPFGEIRNG